MQPSPRTSSPFGVLASFLRRVGSPLNPSAFAGCRLSLFAPPLAGHANASVALACAARLPPLLPSSPPIPTRAERAFVGCFGRGAARLSRQSPARAVPPPSARSLPPAPLIAEPPPHVGLPICNLEIRFCKQKKNVINVL